MKRTNLSAPVALSLLCGIATLSPQAATAQAATAHAPSEHFPPPGLYRVNDIASQARHNLPRGHVLRGDAHRDGKSGAEMSTTSVFGGSATTQVAGDGGGPTMMCIPAPAGGLPRALPAMAGCRSAPGAVIRGGLQATMHCAHGDTVITTRRLNENTWEFENRVVIKYSEVGGGDAVSPMRAMLEAVIAKGTPEQRREATAQLPNLRAMETEMKAAQATRAALAPQIAQGRASAERRGLSFDKSKPLQEQVMKYTITRIGPDCGAVPAAVLQ